MSAPDDDALRDLLLAVSARDRRAFRDLYDAAAPKLLGTIRRMVRHGAVAEDVLQDVFLRIWQNAGSYVPETASAAAWMNAIARHRCIDVLRQTRPVRTVAADDSADWFEQIKEDRDRERDMVDNATLRRCLRGLDARARSCVLLAYYEGYSREELASRFECPVNTIKTWLHRSLTSLRTCFDGLPG